MIKIVNPFIELGRGHDYNCFGCSPFNEIGLQLDFWEDGDYLVAKWQPRKSLEGWMGVLHGGIQATLLDEIAGWIKVFKKSGEAVSIAYHGNVVDLLEYVRYPLPILALEQGVCLREIGYLHVRGIPFQPLAWELSGGNT